MAVIPLEKLSASFPELAEMLRDDLKGLQGESAEEVVETG